jgi:DNA-binding transcriptional LysR family regulator
MDLKRLRTFVAVVEEGGFGRAARRLNVAQPAVSKQVRDLEVDLGGALLVRDPAGVRPTTAGERLLADARRLLAEAARVRERARREARGEAARLAVGYNETVFWSGVIPDIVRRFHERHPEVRLTMLPMSSVDQLAALREGRLDAGFLFYRPPGDPDLEGLVVATEPVLLAVPRASRWASRPPERLAALAGEPFLLFPRAASPPYHDDLLRACGAAGLRLDVVQEAMNETGLLGLVAVGMGLSFAPAAARARCPDGVVLVPVSDLVLTVTLELVWPSGHRDDPTLARLAAVTAEARDTC